MLRCFQYLYPSEVVFVCSRAESDFWSFLSLFPFVHPHLFLLQIHLPFQHRLYCLLFLWNLVQKAKQFFPIEVSTPKSCRLKMRMQYWNELPNALSNVLIPPMTYSDALFPQTNQPGSYKRSKYLHFIGPSKLLIILMSSLHIF